jgi:hypothetical protein
MLISPANFNSLSRQPRQRRTSKAGKKRKRKVRGGQKTWEEKQKKNRRQGQPRQKDSQKTGKENVLAGKQLRLIQPEKSHSNRNAAFRAYCLWA